MDSPLCIWVTGASGFIAKSLCRELLRRGHFVWGTDIVGNPDLKGPKNYGHIYHDISKPLDELSISCLSNVDFCFHLAAMADVDEVREQRDKAFGINLKGTYNIAEACRERNIPLIMASTACVYGHSKQRPSTEDGPTNPVDLYGVTKRAGEELVKGLCKRWVILRFGTTYGSGQRPALCTDIFLKAAIWKEAFPIKGTGLQRRNWIYIDDLVDGCVMSMEKFAVCHNEIINLVGAKSIPVKVLAHTCQQIVNNRLTISIDRYPPRPDDVYIEDVSIKKAKRLLDWKPKIDLVTGLTKIYNEWKQTGKIDKIKTL